MRTYSEIIAEIDSTLGMDIINSDISDQIETGRRQLVRNMAMNIGTQLEQNTTLTTLEIHTAVMILIMRELYDSHTNIHTLIPREIVDAVDQALSL